MLRPGPWALENPAENLVGVASAGGEGAITAAQLSIRPANRPTEVLETVPGLVISQHSGEGKANQPGALPLTSRRALGWLPVFVEGF